MSQGTLTVLRGRNDGEGGMRFGWEYTNDTGVELSHNLFWLCRGFDDRDFIIGTEKVSIWPMNYGSLEPGIKVRGEALVRSRVSGDIVRVECVPVD